MSPTDPRHGTDAGAMAHFKEREPLCEPCAQARYVAAKARAVRLLQEGPSRIPLGVEAHTKIVTAVRYCLVESSGLCQQKLSEYATRGPDTMVLRDTQTKILTATAPTLIGLQRRAQGLARLGWTGRWLAENYGGSVISWSRLRVRTHTSHVRRQIADPVLAAYTDLATRQPPPTQGAGVTRGRAAAAGWLPPTVWDNIDDPDEDPLAPPTDEVDEVVVERILAGEHLPATRAERLAVVARTQAQGHSLKALARRTGWNVSRDLRSIA